jgi:NAD(P)-dependent dehydrogenase (short-subunit alcohol dehydrogenase family)
MQMVLGIGGGFADPVARRGGCRMRPQVGSRRTVLITGCSSPQGIGFASARALAAAGHAVHATVRDHTHDRELLAGLDGELLIHDLDLLERATMAPVIEAVLEADGSLDVLINNAGYGLIGGVEQVDLDRARANFETNFFGTVALIQEVLPLFRSQQHGHIINVSTIFAAGLCVPAIGYYVASKAALETVSQALAVEVAPWGVRVTNFQPGPVMTDLSREWGKRLQADDPRPSLSDELYGWVLGDDSPEPQSAGEVAEALVDIVATEAPPLAEQSGAASRGYVAAALRDPTRQSELESLLAPFARSFASAAAPGTQSPSS